ncbi:hypothetical protein EYF80_011835 [Liparis tanakae]|uniref:Uncharacterized protein n=1 Tax=Liparis tanakae TaxID=230148 RepID=A0A4Z2IL37_9TELE|nr:hypothetical protein EYF80_011835 [Liparis tanakae]
MYVWLPSLYLSYRATDSAVKWRCGLAPSGKAINAVTARERAPLAGNNIYPGPSGTWNRQHSLHCTNNRMTGQLPNRISNSTASTEVQGPVKSNIICSPDSDKNQNAPFLRPGLLGRDRGADSGAELEKQYPCSEMDILLASHRRTPAAAGGITNDEWKEQREEEESKDGTYRTKKEKMEENMANHHMDMLLQLTSFSVTHTRDDLPSTTTKLGQSLRNIDKMTGAEEKDSELREVKRSRRIERQRRTPEERPTCAEGDQMETNTQGEERGLTTEGSKFQYFSHVSSFCGMA